MDDASNFMTTAEPEDSKASVINGLAGVAAAVVAEEALSHAHLGGAAGLVAASIGGLVVYGLDHTEFGKTIEHEFFPSAHTSGVMPDCLPNANPISDVISIVSQPFEVPISLDDGLADATYATPGEIVDLETDPIDNFVGGEMSYLPVDVSPAQSIIDHLTHDGVTICDPPEQVDVTTATTEVAHHHGPVGDII